MRSKVFISLFIVFAMVATAMLPLSTYDNNSISAAGEDGSAGSPFLISNVEELSKVGTGTDGWTLDANYRLTQDIEFSPGDNTNDGVMIDLIITYDADDNEFTVTLDPLGGSSVDSLHIWLGNEHEYFDSFSDSFEGTITAPSDAGKYTMTIGGELSDGTFAYAVKIEITEGMTSKTVVSTTFDSNGNFNPIGELIGPDDYSKAFSGIFDGAGFEISGMNVAIFSSSDDVYAGLFGFTREGTIKALGVTDGYSISASNSYIYAGGIVGHAQNSQIENCYNASYITAAAYENSGAYVRVGGIAGYAGNQSGTDEHYIKNCHNTGDVSVTINSDAFTYVGGIAGYTDDFSITNCYNTGNITAMVYENQLYTQAQAHAGGIAGYAPASSITNCYNTGNITVTVDENDMSARAYAGGIAGDAPASSITNCYNTGDVTATTDGSVASAYAGGIVGSADNLSSTMDHYIKNCYNTGDVTATANGNNVDVYAGGIAGYANKSLIENCYNIGNVTATADGGQVMAYAGGIVGRTHNSSITNCYNAGDVTDTADGGDVEAYAGGIAGYADDESIIHSYFLVNGLELTGNAGYVKVEGDDSGSRSPDLMKKMETYTGWNFETDPITWSISSDLNDGFPVLEVFMFTLTLEFEGDGNVTGPVRIYGGSTATVIMVPDEGGKIISVNDNGNDVTALVSNNEHVLKNIFGDRTVKVVFESIAVPDVDPEVDDNSWGLIILIIIMTTVVCSAYFFALKDRDDDEKE